MAFTRPKAAQIDFDLTNITDPIIRLNSGQSGSADKDVGIVIERGSDTNVAILYDESADEFVFVNTTEDGTTSGNVTISSYADIKVNSVNTDGIQIFDNNITTTRSNDNLYLDPAGTGNIVVTSHILPAIDVTYDLGSSTYKFRDLYLSGSSIKLGSATITASGSAIILPTGSTISGGSGDVVDLNSSQTLTNKTLTAPVISSISNTGTLTLPTSTDTLVGRATTDTLTNKTLTSPQINTNADLLARGEVRFYDTDSSNYVALRASGTVTSNLTFSLPTAYGDNEQVLTTDGAGGTSWTTASGGGGTTGFTNSTVTTAPGSSGNYDLAEGPAQDGDETPFESSSLDAFGVALGTIYDCMEPVGSLTTVDYGDSEAYVGA